MANRKHGNRMLLENVSLYLVPRGVFLLLVNLV